MQPKVFNAIHAQRQNVNGDANIIAWATANGLDGAKFKEVFTSFGVASKAKRASQMTDAYKVAGVPAMAVAGRWYVDGETAGNMTKRAPGRELPGRRSQEGLTGPRGCAAPCACSAFFPFAGATPVGGQCRLHGVP
jgi:hypothetical protein